jgi:hypothetical protein
MEWFRDGAYGGNLSAEQQELMRQMFQRGWAAFKAGTLKETQLFNLGMSWKGTTNFLGWASVKDALKPELRGPIAYLLGNRFLKLKRPEDAKEFFRIALQDAPNDSLLQRLARTALDEGK